MNQQCFKIAIEKVHTLHVRNLQQVRDLCWHSGKLLVFFSCSGGKNVTVFKSCHLENEPQFNHMSHFKRSV